jgi:hypothetical protein
MTPVGRVKIPSSPYKARLDALRAEASAHFVQSEIASENDVTSEMSLRHSCEDLSITSQRDVPSADQG